MPLFFFIVMKHLNGIRFISTNVLFPIFCLRSSLYVASFRVVTQSQQQQAPPDTIAKANNGIERLKKRMGQYRQHHTECGPRFDQSFSGACEQQSHETIVLQKRFLENKAKKAAKKADKKQPDNTSLAGNLQSSVHVVSWIYLFTCCFISYLFHIHFSTHLELDIP